MDDLGWFDLYGGPKRISTGAAGGVTCWIGFNVAKGMAGAVGKDISVFIWHGWWKKRTRAEKCLTTFFTRKLMIC